MADASGRKTNRIKGNGHNNPTKYKNPWQRAMIRISHEHPNVRAIIVEYKGPTK